jgi:3-hydroxyisobutyrate dehydrogenase-like beta-hydroxyacid dehydrogenase
MPSPPPGLQQAVGFIGLGLMGAPMAGRLLDQGFALAVYNRTPQKADSLRARGASVASNPKSLAESSGVICLMLADTHAVRSVMDGPAGLSAGLGPGKTVLNLGTVGREAAIALSTQVHGTGADYLDAPVLGSIQPAAAGELLIFAAGEAPAIERCGPILRALSRRIFHLGAVGQASSMKLVANMLLARYTEALAEVLVLAQGLRLDPQQVFEIIQASALASPMWEKGKALLLGPPPLHFPMRHMTKDLRLLDEEVDRLGLALPCHETVLATFQEAVQAGLGDRDYSEILRLFERGA